MQKVIFIIWHSDWHSGGTWMSLKVSLKFVPQMSSKLSLKVFLNMAMINSLDTAQQVVAIFVTSDGKFIGKGRAFQDIEDQFTLW